MRFPVARQLALTALVSLTLVSAGCAQPWGKPESHADATTMTKQMQAGMTPTAALQRLKHGNERFVAGQSLARNLRAQVHETGSGQYPFASVVACVDSRSAPEQVFDRGIGDIFSGRVAGNFVNADLLGSLEFASKVAGSKLIVVLGHSECGAIKGACDGVKMGNLTATLSHLQPAIDAVTDVPGARSSKNPEFVSAVTDMNVRLTLEAIRKQSPILAEMIAKGEIDLVGAIYDVRTGVVDWLE